MGLQKRSNVEKSKKLPLWLRWWGLGIGAVTFFWLPIEDVGTDFITLLAAAWSVWMGGWLWTRFAKRWGLIFRGAAIGGVSGAIFFPAALILVMIKAGIHDHGFLDYSNYELEALLAYTPWIVLAGMLLGVLISYLLRKWGKNGVSGQNV